MKYFFTVFLLLGLFFNIHAQNAKIDSLQRELQKSGEDTNRVKILIRLAKYLGNTNTENIKTYSEKALFLSKKLKWEEGMCQSYNGIAIYYDIKGDYHKSIEYNERALKMVQDSAGKNSIRGNIAITYTRLGNYEKALEIHNYCLLNVKPNSNQQAKVYQNMAGIYTVQGNYEKTIECEYKALVIYEKTNDLEMQGNISLNIGMSHRTIKQDDKALFYFQKALSIGEKLNHKSIIINAKNLIATIFINQKKYELAHKNLFDALRISNEMQDLKMQVNISTNIAILFGKQKNFIDALEWQKKVVTINEQIGSKYIIAHSYSNLASLYTDIKDYNNAKIFYNKSLIIAQKLDTKTLLSDIKIGLAKLFYLQNGSKDSSYIFLEEANSLKDSILNEKTNEKIIRINTQYETAKKESENQRLRAEKAEQANTIQKRNTMIAGVGTLFVLSFAGFGLYTYRKRHQVAQARIQKHEQVSQKIGQELHDGIAGTLLAVTKKYEQDSLLAQEISKIRSEVRFLSHQLGAFLDADLIDKLNTFIKEYKQIYPKISFDFPAPLGNWTNLDKDVQLAIYRIVQQGVTNALQHSGADQITVNLFQNKDIIELEIQDNGKGIDLENLRKGAGLLSMEDRCKVLGGKLEILADSGTIILAKIPIKYKKI